MAKNTGKGHRKGQVKDRYQVFNDRTETYDKYDSDGNYMRTKADGTKWKGVEEREARKPPR